MSGSADLAQKLQSPFSVTVQDKGGYMGSWSNSSMVNGAHRECLPGWTATPMGNSPYGFLICQRETNKEGVPPEVSYRNHPDRKPQSLNSFVPYSFLEKNSGAFYSQTYDLYKNKPASEPRTSMLGGPAVAFAERRYPNQATLQGSDYYRDCIKFRGIGIEHLEEYPGNYGYEENKYYFSAPPPIFDITQSVQPYDIWRREQVRMGTLTADELKEFEKVHTYQQNVDAF